MSEYDKLIRDTLTPKISHDAFCAVAEAAALREREKWEKHRLILLEKQYVLNKKLVLGTRREAFGDALREWRALGNKKMLAWLREQAGEGE